MNLEAMISGFGGSEPNRLINASSRHSPISMLISVIKAAHYPPASLLSVCEEMKMMAVATGSCIKWGTTSVDLK
jgi:hypothetical protein